MSNKTPEEVGFQSIVIIKQADMRFMTDLMTWLNEVWFPENGYETGDAIMRNTDQGYYEVMARPIL